jgi:putative metallohydrolase (TIGR04338 family)
MPRDSQRSKLYAAEVAVKWVDNERLETVEEMETWVRHILASKWLTNNFPSLRNIEIGVKDGRGRSQAGGSHSYITMPKWSRSKDVVLHEISHSFISRIYGHENVAAHGREYARILLLLVRHFMGKENYLRLRASFKECRVRFSLRKNRQVDPSKPKRVMPVAALEALRKYREEKRARQGKLPYTDVEKKD